MADWLTIPDTSLDPDAPLTSQLAYAWRDNPVAIAEGASGAPRINVGAFEAPVAGGANIVARMPPITRTGAGTTTSQILNVVRSGTIRLTFDFVASAGTVDVRRVGTTDTIVYNAAATGSFSVDFSITRGQYIYINLIVSGGAVANTVSNIEFKSSSEGGILA